MSENMALGNIIQPLRNVASLVKLIKEVQTRQFGLPGIGVFFGYPGYGKTYAAIHCTVALDAIHISVQKLWTKKTLLDQILRELGVSPKKTLAEMMMQACEHLAIAGRPLLIDEADYAVSRGLIEVIRDLHDGSEVPVILIGMEELPQKLRKWELIDSRIMGYVPAEPATLKDAQFLARIYAPDVQIGDDLLAHIIERNTGNVRRTVTDLAYVQRRSATLDLQEISLDDWGNASFLRSDAPTPRRGLL